MKLFVVLFVMVAMILPVVSYSADYTIIDKGGNYRGYVSDDGDTVSRYDRHNMPVGWLDKDSGATFDGHNNFQGWVLDDNDDD
ncbi:MAG: hypothetical protein ACLPVO_17725 [Desulfomonilaceae bacterium]